MLGSYGTGDVWEEKAPESGLRFPGKAEGAFANDP